MYTGILDYETREAALPQNIHPGAAAGLLLTGLNYFYLRADVEAGTYFGMVNNNFIGGWIYSIRDLNAFIYNGAGLTTEFFFENHPEIPDTMSSQFTFEGGLFFRSIPGFEKFCMDLGLKVDYISGSIFDPQVYAYFGI